MKYTRNIAMGLVALGISLIVAAVLVLVIAWLTSSPSGAFLLALVVGLSVSGGAAASASALLFAYLRRPLPEVELEQAQQALAEAKQQLDVDKKSLDEARNTATELVAKELAQLDQRQQAFSLRLGTFHEWMEFPQPMSIASDAPLAAIEMQQQKLVEQDRRLSELLKAETKILYDNILSNKYVADGKINYITMRNDVVILAEKVARIYQPDLVHPLLETSLTRVLRAVSRTSLQTLAVFDQLPLTLHDQSFAALHSYLRSAVQAYRVYKTSEPYWPYVNTAYYLSRMAMGAHPLTLSAWWIVGAIGKQGATAVATRLMNHHALKFLSDIVRVIGYEVAALYSPEFRFRDPNWIYAAELTKLVATFPLSRDGLSRSLQEVGSLELRSEYDRIFFYRAIAAHQSGLVREYVSAGLLSSEHRRAIATRLERFFEHNIHGKTPDRVKSWKQGVEQRLGIKLLVSSSQEGQSAEEQLISAVRGVASFLLAVKLLEPPEVCKLIAETRTFAILSATSKQQILEEIETNPPYFLEHPDLDVDGDLPRKFVEDLANMHARTAPRSLAIEQSIADIASYLRLTPATIQAAIDRHLIDQFTLSTGDLAGVRKPPVAVARAVLDLLSVGEPITLLFGNVTLEVSPTSNSSLSNKPIASTGEFWLAGNQSELWLIDVAGESRIVWKSDASTQISTRRNYLSSLCTLTGGVWLDGDRFAPRPWLITLAAGMLSSYQAYFKPLLERPSAPRARIGAIQGDSSK